MVVMSVFKHPETELNPNSGIQDKLVSSNTVLACRISCAKSDKINLLQYLNAILRFTSINLG
jgi:hypothetical protein